jgi:hypothetical protein
MTKFYRNYIWKKAIPYGIEEVQEGAECAYKIPSDPYRKRIAVEEWRNGKFFRVVYDSALFDFRHLQPADQNAWQKVNVLETKETVTSQIRNQDDRTILIEVYHFEGGICRSCMTSSAHGIPVSQQKMYYIAHGELFNGVILSDMSGRPVMFKSYKCDETTGEYTDLLKEEWDMIKAQPPLQHA